MKGFQHGQWCVHSIFVIVSSVVAGDLHYRWNNDLNPLVHFKLAESWLLVWHPKLVTFTSMRENAVAMGCKTSMFASFLHKRPFSLPQLSRKSSCITLGIFNSRWFTCSFFQESWCGLLCIEVCLGMDKRPLKKVNDSTTHFNILLRVYCIYCFCSMSDTWKHGPCFQGVSFTDYMERYIWWSIKKFSIQWA